MAGMSTAYILLIVWALIGALAGGVFKAAASDKVFFGRVIDGALGGCVAGTLVYNLELGLPLYFGSLLSAAAGAILFVMIIDRWRAA